MRNRIIALLLACVMTVSLLPVSALALESSDNNTAAQEAAVITTPEEFAAMTSDGAYRLGADKGIHQQRVKAVSLRPLVHQRFVLARV